ncbi:efflux transporter [Ramaria rubella]|nr:efflux transporter [Ramaria rubella]
MGARKEKTVKSSEPPQPPLTATGDKFEVNEQTIPRKRSFFNATCLILTCCSGMALNTFTTSSTSIALPDMGRSLNIEEDRLQWAVSAFALSSGCFLLLCGRVADIHGRRLAFRLGTAWTAIFALVCGFAKTEIQLFILQGMQGIGSAAVIPASLGILAHSFPPSRQRSVAFAVFSAGAPFGAGLGFTIGGFVTEFSTVTWRGIFFLTCGLSALSSIAAFYFIDPDTQSTEIDKRVDWIGAVLVTSGLVLITFVLGQGPLAPNGWRTPYIIALLIIGVFLVVCFLFFEHYLATRSTRQPLMRLELWTRAQGRFSAMQGVAFLEWCAFDAWILWTQLYYQAYKNYSPVRAMIRLLPMTVTGLILNFIVGSIVGWIDAVWLLVVGTIATGCACVLFALIDPLAPYWAFGFPAAILAVFGADFIFSCGTLFVARVAHPHEQSVAGGVFQTVTQLGIAFGVAITTNVHNRVVVEESARADITLNAHLSNVPPEIMLKGFKAAQWTGFGFAMGGLLIAVIFLRSVGVVGHGRASASVRTVENPSSITTLSGLEPVDEETEEKSVDPTLVVAQSQA